VLPYQVFHEAPQFDYENEDDDEDDTLDDGQQNTDSGVESSQSNLQFEFHSSMTGTSGGWVRSQEC